MLNLPRRQGEQDGTYPCPCVSCFSGAMLCAHSGTKILEAASGSDLTPKVTRRQCHNDHGWVPTTRAVLTLMGSE